MPRVAGLFPDGERRLRNELTFVQLCSGVLCAGESAD